MQGWKAWYADGSVYASSDTRWTALPKVGIIGVVVYLDPPYRELVNGGDWYYLDGGVPTCTETASEWGAFIDPPDVPPDELKLSGSVPDDEWADIQTAMMEDRQWP